jgi:hypothetical protein
VLGRNDEHQLVQQARSQAFLALPERMATHDPEIHLVRPDALLDEGRVGDLELELDPGIARPESGKDAREHVDAGRRARPDDERAAPEPAQLADGLAGAVQGGEETLRMPLEDAPGLGTLDRAPEAIEEPRAELPLQLADVLGQGRLAEVKRLRRAPKASRARDSEKHLELPE